MTESALTHEEIISVGWQPDTRKHPNFGYVWENDKVTTLVRAYPDKEVWIMKIYGETSMGTQGTVYFGIIKNVDDLRAITENTGISEKTNTAQL